MQPRACEGPVALDCRRRHLEKLGRLVDRQPAEEPQLDDFRGPRRYRRQAIEGVVEGREIDVQIDARGNGLEIDDGGRVITLVCRPPTGVIHKNAAHGLGRRSVEVHPVFESALADLRQSEIRLVDQCGGLQGVIGPLVTHLIVGETSELGVHQRHQRLQRGRVARPPPRQQVGHVGHRGRILPYWDSRAGRTVRVCRRLDG